MPDTPSPPMGPRHDAFLLALRDRVRNEADTGVILSETTARLAHHFQANRTGYGELDETGEIFYPRNHWIDGTVVSIDDPLPFAIFGERITGGLRRGEIWIHENLDDPKLDDAGRETCRELGIFAAITVPLIRDGRFVALLSVQYGAPHAWDPGDVELIHEVADRTWATLERARAEEARRASEAELERSREALYQSEKMTALGSLLAGVSHELNNPLSIIVAQAELLEIEAANTPAAVRAGKVRSAANRAARIVQTFLAMARQKQPNRTRVELNQVATAALELTAYGLKSNGVGVRLDLDPALPPLLADADQLHQVVLNLVVNAQQALQDWPGERVLSVATRPGGDARTVELTVADSGPGIPMELRRRIFEPFFTTKPQDVGTGVGLSFSQGIVEAHDGRLDVIDSPTGATFRVTLPAERGVSVAVDAPSGDTRPLSAPDRRTALIVDDEQDVASALGDILAHLGFSATLVHSGAEARRILATSSFDLILSDVRMPDIDGPALFSWLGETRPALVETVAFSTGDTLSAAAAKFLQEAGRPFMEKPFTLGDVHRLVEAVDQQRAGASGS